MIRLKIQALSSVENHDLLEDSPDYVTIMVDNSIPFFVDHVGVLFVKCRLFQISTCLGG